MGISLFLSRSSLQSALSLRVQWSPKCWVNLPVSAGAFLRMGYLLPGERFSNVSGVGFLLGSLAKCHELWTTSAASFGGSHLLYCQHSGLFRAFQSQGENHSCDLFLIKQGFTQLDNGPLATRGCFRSEVPF